MANPRKPTALKVLNGSWDHHPERRNMREPQPSTAAPKMPTDLDPAAKAVWNRVMREQAPGVILAAHADVFRVYCETVVRYEAWSKLLAQSGPIIRGARGSDLVKNPLVGMVRDQADQIRMFARELGLTPSALSGISVADTSGEPSRVAGLLTSRRQTG